jgi:uncharacterized spore protein YtfJ
VNDNTTERMMERLSKVPELVGAEKCFGQPVERDGHTLIPVARVGFGFGMGFGRGTGSDGKGATGETGEGEGGGGGGGGMSAPVAVVDITSDEVKVKPVTDTTLIAMRNLMLAGWVAFWLLLTIRTVSRERARTRRHELDKGLAG